MHVPGVISVRPGTSVDPIQKTNLQQLIESGVVKSGDAIYVEKRESAVHKRLMWGIIQLGTGLTTIYIKPTPDATISTPVQLKDIEHFVLFNVCAFSDIKHYNKFRG